MSGIYGAWEDHGLPAVPNVLQGNTRCDISRQTVQQPVGQDLRQVSAASSISLIDCLFAQHQIPRQKPHQLQAPGRSCGVPRGGIAKQSSVSRSSQPCTPLCPGSVKDLPPLKATRLLDRVRERIKVGWTAIYQRALKRTLASFSIWPAAGIRPRGANVSNGLTCSQQIVEGWWSPS